MTTIRIFPNGQVEVGNGKPGYRWDSGYSQKNDDGSVSNALTRAHWRAIAKRDGADLELYRTEKEASL